MAARGKTKSRSHHEGQLRIIGGQWRGRKLQFREAEGLRPTGDRIRETLFNWLAPTIEGARCLDLFAGSGALGLEALSRGAELCDFVELNRDSAREIRQHLQTLRCESGRVFDTPAGDFLRNSDARFDIVFLDPPFKRGLLSEVLPLLGQRLKPDSLVYLEHAADEFIDLPKGWVARKHKTAGQVCYGLYQADIDLDEKSLAQ